MDLKRLPSPQWGSSINKLICRDQEKKRVRTPSQRRAVGARGGGPRPQHPSWGAAQEPDGLGTGRGTGCLRGAPHLTQLCRLRKSTLLLWAVMETVRSGPANGWGEVVQSTGLSVNSLRLLAGVEWIGSCVLPGALSRTGLAEMFPVLKIAVGTELRGRGGGSFGTWVGRLTPFLFLLGPLWGSAPWIQSI